MSFILVLSSFLSDLTTTKLQKTFYPVLLSNVMFGLATGTHTLESRHVIKARKFSKTKPATSLSQFCQCNSEISCSISGIVP